MTDRWHTSYHIVCLALIPFLLLAINPNVFVNPAGNDFVDPWVYTGFLLDLPDLLHRFGDTYYATRLPWLLPGFAIHTILPPLAANYALHLAFFYVLLLATYALVASGASRSAAFVATLLVAWNPVLLTSFSWDYIDGAGIVFLVCALCALERATHGGKRWWAWAAAAGATMASLVATNLALATALPACAAFLLVRAESPRWRSASRILAVAIAGALLLLVALCGVNHAMGGAWNFLQPSFYFARQIRTAANIWKAPRFDWWQAEWLVLPICGAIGAAAYLARRHRASSRFAQAPQVALLVLMATWLLLQVFADAALFRYPYYASYIVALAAIAVVLQGRGPADDIGPSTVLTELAILIALSAPHVLAWIDPPHRYGYAGWAPLMLLAGVLGLQFIRLPSMRWALFIVGVLMAYAASNQYWKILTPGGRADFANAASAHRFIAHSVAGRGLRLWYPPMTPTSPPIRSVACTYLCNRLALNEDLPRLTREEAQTIAPETRLVLLVHRASEAEDARASLRAFGLDYTVVAHEQFGPADRRFLVIVADVVPAQPHA